MVKDKIELSVAQCWTILGKDPVGVINTIKNYGKTDDDLVYAAEKALSNAKKIAKKLQAKFHPDRNQHDPKAAVKFRRVTLAIQCLEQHTMELKANREILKQRSHSSEKDVIYFKG